MLRIILLFSVLAGGAFSTLSAEDYYSVYYLRVTVPHHGGDVQGFVVVAGFPEDSVGDAEFVEQRLRREVVNGQLVLYGQRFLYQTPDEQTHFILMEPRTVPIRASTPLSIEVLERTSALDYITGQFQLQDTL